MTIQASRTAISEAFAAAVHAKLAYWDRLMALEELLFPDGKPDVPAFERVMEYVEDRAVTQSDIPLGDEDVETVLTLVQK